MPLDHLEGAVADIVDSIFAGTLGIPVSPTHTSPIRALDESVFSGVVQISGAWQGAVAVRVTQGLAREAAVAMMSIPVDSLALADIQDTVGELANMTGGNIKALLPEPCFLGLPVVATGADLRMRLPGSRVRFECAFARLGQYATITLLERETAAAA